MIKIEHSYDIERIRKEVDLLRAEHLKDHELQLLLQSIDGTDWHNTTAPYKMREDLRETDFKTPNTPADWEITRFMVENDLSRTRVMILPFRKCYSWHKDVGNRMHLAVTTNDKCFFVENNQVVNVPADGHPYLLNVNDYHTAMNCSDVEFSRIHLVGVLR